MTSVVGSFGQDRPRPSPQAGPTREHAIRDRTEAHRIPDVSGFRFYPPWKVERCATASGMGRARSSLTLPQQLGSSGLLNYHHPSAIPASIGPDRGRADDPGESVTEQRSGNRKNLRGVLEVEHHETRSRPTTRAEVTNETARLTIREFLNVVACDRCPSLTDIIDR